MPDSLERRLKSEGNIPVIDCIVCGKTDVPVFYTTIDFRPAPYCLCCHIIIPTNFVPKGFVTMIDLEETEWDSEI